MKTLLGLVLFLTSLTAHAATTTATNSTIFELDNSKFAPTTRLGTELMHRKVQMARANYSFAVQGGSSLALITLRDDQNKPFKLPSKAVILNVIIDVQTTFTSGGLATIALGANTTSDLKTGTAVASYAAGLIAGTPVGTAASAVKLTADRTLSMTVGVVDLTAGKMSVLVTYMISE